jgi:argininosuccinate synthase
VQALEGFVEVTQEKVTGTATVKLEGGQARAVGRQSDYAVYSESHASFNSADVEAGIEQSDATGVAKYHGFQERLAKRAYDSAKKKKTEAVTDGGDDE